MIIKGEIPCPKSVLLAAVALASLVGACSQGDIPRTDAPATSAVVTSADNSAVEAAKAVAALAAQQAANEAAERARLRVSIETALAQDTVAGKLGSEALTVKAMREIDTSNTPGEYRAAYVTHIQAWEDVARLKAAWARIDTDENNGVVLVAGVACALLDCPATPIADRLEAERQYRRALADANTRISSSFREVERIAALYGAHLPV